MKNPIKFIIYFFIATATINSTAQDSLTVEQLEPFTYTFNIENGIITGPGAEFLNREMSQAQFTMIGEYHGSCRISEFTTAIIPVLNDAGYKTMALEVGPITGQYLNSFDQNAKDSLQAINIKYSFVEEDGYINPTIPFFEFIEDALFLEEVKKNSWDVIGIDQEFSLSYILLFDILYDNLNNTQKRIYKEDYRLTMDSLQAYNKEDIYGESRISISVKNSPLINDFLEKMSQETRNTEIIEAIKMSNHIYSLNATRQWFENNELRIKYMKEQLRKQLLGQEFDMSKDKLLIKMGGIHLSKGFSPLGFYEVGNMLNEFANFNGNTALNVAFSNRFYSDEGEIIDILESTNKRHGRLKELNQMGKKDEWVVIDLRRLIKGHFYNPVIFKFNEHVEDLVQRYDLLIIPKTEIDPTPNHISK